MTPKGGRQAEMENTLHVFTLQYWIDFCASTKKNPIDTEWASHDHRKSMEGNCPIKAVCITDAKDCFWSNKANDFHSCSIKSSKLEPFSVLDIQSVLNLMQFLHTHRNMHSVFLWKSRPVNMKQPLQKNCFPKNFSQRWSN